MATMKLANKIFVVDDSVFVHTQLMGLLPDMGFELIGAAYTSKDAFRYIAETHPDIVLIDINIPGINIRNIIKGIQAISRNITIIVMGPLAFIKTMAQLFRDGISDFIPKPIIPTQLEYVLKKYEVSAGYQMRREIDIVALIMNLFLNELLIQSPGKLHRVINKSILSTLKRLSKEYSDRYIITYDPIRITVKLYSDVNPKRIKSQLLRIYPSILNKLYKYLPKEYIISLVNEAYEALYPILNTLYEILDFKFPIWENFDVNKYGIVDSDIVRYTYEQYYHIFFSKEYFYHGDINEHFKPYKFYVEHDPRVIPKFPRKTKFNLKKLDIHVLLSYFDDILGPVTAIIYPSAHGKIEEDKLKSIPKLLDLIGIKPNEPFIHSTGDYGTINVIFSVPMKTRGGFKDFMLSVMISPAEIQVMVKLHQMGGVFKATSQLVSNYFREHPDVFLDKRAQYILDEPQRIIVDMYSDVKKFLETEDDQI